MAESQSISVGVLCIQGAFIEHIRKLNEVGQQSDIPLTVTEVRRPDQLSSLDGLIIPGGESTTLSVFLSMNGFEESVRRWMSCDKERPGVVWGTCAGLILLADELTGQKKGGQVTIGGLKVLCSRNTFGRQMDSFESTIKLHHLPLYETTPPTPPSYIQPLNEDECHAVFIRAPGILKVNDSSIKVLAKHGEDIVAVQQDTIIATTFHPELTNDPRWHKYFVEQIIQRKQQEKRENNFL